MERENKLETIFPDTGPMRRELYPKHMEFVNSTKDWRISVFLAGNRTGKTYTAASLIAQWAQGIYMPWFKGRKFTKPLSILCAGPSNQSLRDVWCKYLLGQDGDGTGFIKKENIVKIAPRAGTSGLTDYATIKSEFGGVSTIYFRSYEQDVDTYMGYTLDVVAYDEEPPSTIYSEVQTRVATTKGSTLMTYTPLKGMSEVTLRIINEQKKPESERNMKIVTCTWDEIPEAQLDAATKKLMISQYSPFEIDARTKGIPSAGQGMFFPIMDDDISVRPFKIPPEWPRYMGFDYGYRRTAAVYLAIDPQTKVSYLYDCLVIKDATPADHFVAMRMKGSLWIPGASETALTMDSGQSRLEYYQELGLNLFPATEAKKNLLAGIDIMWQNMVAGQLKIFDNLEAWFAEKNTYHMNERMKVADLPHDLMDATRYAIVDGMEYATINPDYISEVMETYRSYDSDNNTNPVTGY